MKLIATKSEDLEVDVSEETVEGLMCTLLKAHYAEWSQLDVQPPQNELANAMAIVYEAYAGKPINLVDRFSH